MIFLKTSSSFTQSKVFKYIYAAISKISLKLETKVLFSNRVEWLWNNTCYMRIRLFWTAKIKCDLKIKIIIQSGTKKSFFLWLLFKIFFLSSILNNLNSVMSWYSFLHISCAGSWMSSISWTQGFFCTVAWKLSQLGKMGKYRVSPLWFPVSQGSLSFVSKCLEIKS